MGLVVLAILAAVAVAVVSLYNQLVRLRNASESA